MARRLLPGHAPPAFPGALVRGQCVGPGLDRRGIPHGPGDAPSERNAARAVLRARVEPAVCGVDLKLFSYRPSLIGLGLLNASFAVVQYETYGTLSTAMVLYQGFTLVYLFNYFQFEHGMLHTWDMVAERFGGMLIWGDYVLVPFFYSLPGWFLVHRLEPLPSSAVVGLTGLFLFGFWLFRGANGQKHRFKLDPATRIWGRPAETIGGRLLVSGLWGLGRHLNYSGEIVDLSRLCAHDRVRFGRALPAAGLARRPLDPPRLARRAPLPRQVRRSLDPIYAPGALPPAAARVLKDGNAQRFN